MQDSELQFKVAGRRTVITGGAGFIGSHVADLLVEVGANVVVIDDFDPWYSPERKRTNLRGAYRSPNFALVEDDVATAAVEQFQPGDLVVHLAGRPGVQDSWGPGFVDTSRRNIELTQSVFEDALAAGVERVVYASSSSIYGASATVGGRREPAPISPYGAAKLAGEYLAGVYGARGLDIVSLRYFTVFGPRQRPDMAMHRMFEACLEGEDVFVRRGDGEQRREFTYVGDIARATVAALVAPDAANATLDLGGGSSADLISVMRLVADIAGSEMRTISKPESSGDPRATVADSEPSARLLGWRPTVTLEDGLRAQYLWQSSQPVDDSVIALP